MLVVDSASKRFGSHTALSDVSFEVPRGRVVGFLGPNGAGKTTTMRAVLSLLDLDTGVITWDGQPITPQTRRRFGYMPEERGLYPRMRLLDHIAFLTALAAPPDAAAEEDVTSRTTELLERVGLADLASVRIDQLSFGNRQRVQLVAALAHTPDLLILDEPFSGLDPAAAADLVTLVRSEAARGAAVLFSSHQMDLVADVCDDVVLITKGTVCRRSTLEEWSLSAPTRRLHAVLSGSAAALALPAELRRLPSKSHIIAAEAPATLPATEAAALLDTAAATAGLDVLSFTFTPPPLAELFAAELIDSPQEASA